MQVPTEIYDHVRPRIVSVDLFFCSVLNIPYRLFIVFGTYTMSSYIWQTMLGNTRPLKAGLDGTWQTCALSTGPSAAARHLGCSGMSTQSVLPRW